MLTPSYTATATERVLPRLALDFTTGVLDSRVTITRSLNTATRTNSSGLIEIVNADLPRFDYDPVTLAPRGLLIEETRSNVVLYSQQFNDAGWVRINSATVGADTVTSPDGTTNADTITLSGAFGGVYRTTTIALGTVTASCYFKASTANAAVVLGITDNSVDYGFRFNISTGAIQFINAGLASASITAVGNGWYRAAITRVLVAANPNIYTTIPSGASGNAYHVWGAQLEAGAFATSYIPTTTTSVTRNADVVTMTGTNFSSWYSSTQGAFVAWFDTLRPAGVGYIYSANAGGSVGNSIYQSVFSNTTDNYVLSGGVQQARLLSGTISANTQAKAALRYANANFATAANGGALQTQLSGSLPIGVDRLHIGHSAGGGNFLNGHAAKLFWYANLTNAEIVAFTK